VRRCLKRAQRKPSVVFQANLELANRFIGRAEGFLAVPAEIVRRVLHMFLGTAKGVNGFANLRVRLSGGGSCPDWLSCGRRNHFSGRATRRGWGRQRERQHEHERYDREHADNSYLHVGSLLLSELQLGRTKSEVQVHRMQPQKPSNVPQVSILRGAIWAALGMTLAVGSARGQSVRDCGSGVSLRISSTHASQGALLKAELRSASALADLKAQWMDRAIPFWDDDRDPHIRRAFLGVDLQQPPGEYEFNVTAQLPDGAHVSCNAMLIAREGQFPVENLKVPEEFVEPSPQDLERAGRERQRLREIFAINTAERLWRGAFRLPVASASARNTRNFGRRRILNGESRSPHTGVDFPAPVGTPVHAAQRGRVTLAENLFFSGNTVVIDHGLGVYTLYAHLESISVQEGDVVEAGAAMGRVGATGNVTGPHLHWGLTVNEARANPLDIVGPAPTAKKPATRGASAQSPH